jgi:hypothetical protein
MLVVGWLQARVLEYKLPEPGDSYDHSTLRSHDCDLHHQGRARVSTRGSCYEHLLE